MKKPERPRHVCMIIDGIIGDMERGSIDNLEAIRQIQRFRFNEKEMLAAIIYCYDYGKWMSSRSLVSV